ncbi:hypothetical protein COCC4DRAFT_79615 [Bipolaris maydis ATCC 48331]|uniref:Uncharacterized protein n=2 Tax=Cochliobolus heterostrophus TaxID=5016 RepID=M2V2C7_COCH5|nr:uncharacterized protein COCC4DRAFT_79615 [Bipolaris maydis ATCC 48331]EMD94132.1 hypothetical protein COCHEDRAFT_1130423 [Bipolaris maydis C5]KAJ5026675.1 hypothetical protein J3E73DRAFT_423400 [Bipolaris maydis]ENI07567.1 hypothetical protein COCC4DRAFT_79615 [Bipolaris maydis ATCC 48331]KAJ5059589.1 hypothetical protein J3E74DRAFT_246223 [Bipolaris maydis]KAJ6209581.1 hypothetical protein PSV09DRAFT_1130423 [Bipolaris maydis]
MIDELLVHISAPTTRQSDQLYQSLADAYLTFEADVSHRGSSRQIDFVNQSASSRLNVATAPDQGSSLRGTADASNLSTSKDSYGSFPSHLSLDGLKNHENDTVRSGDHAVKDDSPPMFGRLAQSEHAYRDGKYRRSLRSSSTKRNLLVEKVPGTPADVDLGFVENTQPATEVLHTQLQESYLKNYDDTPASDTDEERIQDSTIESLVTATPDTKEEFPERRRSMRLKAASSVAETPIPTAKLSAKPDAFATSQRAVNPDDALNSSSPASWHTTCEEKGPEDSSQVAPPIDFSKFQIDVYPPEPKISTARPGTLPSQITPQLAALKQQNPKRFKPIRIGKKPKPDDRGYWLISCSHWSAQLQQAFWNNICEQVTSGKLGWGVMLYREGRTSRSLGQVKLYCWGEIVEHTWLVLWLCSKGKVSGSGLEWIDADGDAVFLMS